MNNIELSQAYCRLQRRCFMTHDVMNLATEEFGHLRRLTKTHTEAMQSIAGFIEQDGDLLCETTRDCIMITSTFSKAKQPAMAVLSADHGQLTSPSALSYRRNGVVLMQLFEKDADDTEMANRRTVSPNRVKAQGRMLQY